MMYVSVYTWRIAQDAILKVAKKVAAVDVFKPIEAHAYHMLNTNDNGSHFYIL